MKGGGDDDDDIDDGDDNEEEDVAWYGIVLLQLVPKKNIETSFKTWLSEGINVIGAKYSNDSMRGAFGGINE